MMVLKPTEAPLFPFWIEDRGLSFFFGFLVFITIFVTMVHLSRCGRIALDLIFSFVVFSSAVETIGKQILISRVFAKADGLLGHLYHSHIIATLVGLSLKERDNVLTGG